MSIASSVGVLFGSIGRARTAQNTFNRLSNMSDEALANRGISRQDIARVAFQDISDF